MNIQNSNTVDIALTPKQLADAAAPVLGPAFAPLAAFCHLSEQTGLVATGSGNVPIIAAVGNGQTTATNFETGDATFGMGLAAIAHFSRSGYVSASQRNMGHRAEWLIPSLIRRLGADLFNAATATITAANHGGASATVAEASFDVAELSTLIQNVAGTPRCALLSTLAMQNVAPDLLRENGSWVWPGLDGGAFEFTESLMESGIYSAVATPEAVVGVIGKPSVPNTPKLTVTRIAIEGLGVAVWLHEWFDLGTRAHWVSADVLAGFAKGQAGSLSYAAAP